MKNSPPKSIPPATMLYEVSRGRKYSAQPRHMIDTSTQYEREYFIPSLANPARVHVSQVQPIPGEGAPISPCLTELFPTVDCFMFEDTPFATPALGQATANLAHNSLLNGFFEINQLVEASPQPLIPLITGDCDSDSRRESDEMSARTIRSLVGTTRSSQSGFVLQSVSSIVSEVLSSDSILPSRDEHETSVTASQDRYRPAG